MGQGHEPIRDRILKRRVVGVYRHRLAVYGFIFGGKLEKERPRGAMRRAGCFHTAEPCPFPRLRWRYHRVVQTTERNCYKLG